MSFIPAPNNWVAEKSRTSGSGVSTIHLSVVGFDENGAPVTVPRTDLDSSDFGTLVAAFYAPDLVPGRPGGQP